MGPGRDGAYTYAWIERRLGVPIENADSIISEFQHLEVGDEIRPGTRCGPRSSSRSGRLSFRSSNGRWVWSFHLASANGRTRLVTCNRFDTSGYRPKDWLGYAVMEPGSWVMERKMLL
jgi:hypothetical protein